MILQGTPLLQVRTRPSARALFVHFFLLDVEAELHHVTAYINVPG